MNRLTGKRAHNDDHARRNADTPQKTRSGCCEAAFDRVRGACRIAGIIAQQIGHKARNIFRRAVPTEWTVSANVFLLPVNTSSASLKIMRPAMGPGQQALTLTPRAPCSSAAVLVKPMMACLEAT